MTGTEHLHIRPLTEADLPLVRHWLPFGDPDKHHARFTRQEAGEVLYLSAWLNEVPVGHLLLKWTGSGERPDLVDCPDIEDLVVAESFRRRGIASRLLEAAESEARGRGYSRIGLSVGIDNMPARALYDRRGYREYDDCRFEISGTYRDDRGQEHTWREICTYRIKNL